MDYDIIFIMGPQGSGKGTQARILTDKLGFFFWETGAVLRKNADVMTSSGIRTRDLLKTGRLFTDEELFSVAEAELKQIPKDRGIIFDGIPRRIGQAKVLLELLKSYGKKRFATILIDLPEEESFKRLLLRAEKEGRSDDTRKGIERRLADYRENTVPMLDFMKENTEFFAIDGRPSIEDVAKEVAKTLKING